MNSVDFWTNGILGEAVLFPVWYMCLGSICSCAYTWHYDSAYRSERVLAVQTCIFVDFVCFQNMNSSKLCVYSRAKTKGNTKCTPCSLQINFI